MKTLPVTFSSLEYHSLSESSRKKQGVDFFGFVGYNKNSLHRKGAVHTHRRWWAIFLALILVFCSAAAAEDDDEEFEFDDDDSGGFEYFDDLSGFDERNNNQEAGDYTYQLNEEEDGAFIVKYHGEDSDLVVPDHMESYPLIGIGDHAFEDFAANITSVQLPEGITWIGVQSFATCDRITEMVIPEGVVRLDDRCFLGCKTLEKITIPDSVTTIGDMAFAVCMSLKEITFGPNLEHIGANAFQACQALERVTLPAGIEIPETAFLGCSPDLEIIMR